MRLHLNRKRMLGLGITSRSRVFAYEKGLGRKRLPHKLKDNCEKEARSHSLSQSQLQDA